MMSSEMQHPTTVTKDGKARAELNHMQDPNALRLFWHLFGGSRGGYTRLKIIGHLLVRPYNRNQLAKMLGFDYKAIQHHLEVLEKNNLITRQGEDYGIMFFISPYLEAKIDALEGVMNKVAANSSFRDRREVR